MLQSDDEWLSIVDTFNAAATGTGSWHNALSRLAQATGSRAGELVGFGSEKSVPFNWVTDLGQDWAEEFVAIGGGDPAINPFVRMGLFIPELTIRASGDVITREERRNNPFIADHATRHDIPHICLSPLIRENGMLVGLAVLRSARQGEIDDHQREAFASIAPHVRAAVKTQMALENQWALLVAGTLESMSKAVFVCDQMGNVKSMTPMAETLVSAGNGLRLKNGLLSTALPAETDALHDAIRIAAGGLVRPGAPLSNTVLVRGNLTLPLILEVVPLPRSEHVFGIGVRVLVIARGVQPDPDHMKRLLQLAYALTSAEADVALRLVDGLPPEAIATARNASIGTVRVQIRAIYAKLGVHHLSELTARINALR